MSVKLKKLAGQVNTSLTMALPIEEGGFHILNSLKVGLDDLKCTGGRLGVRVGSGRGCQHRSRLRASTAHGVGDNSRRDIRAAPDQAIRRLSRRREQPEGAAGDAHLGSEVRGEPAIRTGARSRMMHRITRKKVS